MATPLRFPWYGLHLMAGTSVVESAPGWMLPVIFNPTSTLLPAPTTTRGTNEENLLTASESVGLKLTSSSAYTFPLSSTSVVGTLKMVCCAGVSEKVPKNRTTRTNRFTTLRLILTKYSLCFFPAYRFPLNSGGCRRSKVKTANHLDLNGFDFVSDYGGP